MNGRERILTALELGQPDVVPIWEMAYNEPSIIGIARNFMPADKLPDSIPVMDMTDNERFQLLEALITFVRELDLDGVTARSHLLRKNVWTGSICKTPWVSYTILVNLVNLIR